MKRIIAGATGFIGQYLVKKWLAEKYEIIVIGRSRAKIKNIFNDTVQAIEWNELAQQHNIFDNAQIILNLAGTGIGEARWTESRKQEILLSRTEATRQLAELCASYGAASPPLFNANAVGVYGLQREACDGLPVALDENTPINFQQAPDFLAEVARKWELAALPAKTAGVRVVYLRFGVVLAKHGGVLPRLSLPFRLFLGGPIGTGCQPFSWISLIDLGAAIEFLLQHSDISGAVNLVAPDGITQKQLAVALGKALHRPSLLPTPAFVLKLIFGQMAEELLLAGQHVVPTRLLQRGFTFQYPTIETALASIYQ
jgi:uncharacterized protein (TIGR01777 family)